MIVFVPEKAPCPVGVNVMTMLHVAALSSVPPQVVVFENPVPAVTMLEMVIVVPLLFESTAVTVFDWCG